jgi:hypothetical protein
MPQLRPACLALTALILLPPGLTAAQESAAETDRPIDAPNAIYFELGGNGIIYTFNYDRRFQDKLTGRIGLMYVGGSVSTSEGESGEADILLIPVMVNGLLGGGNHRFELGLGPVFAGASGSGTTVEGVDFEASGFGFGGVASTIGYRHQPVDGGFVFRIGLTPFLLGDFALWGGLSLGYAF